MLSLISIELKKIFKIKTFILILLFMSIFITITYRDNSRFESNLKYSKQKLYSEVQELQFNLDNITEYSNNLKANGELEEYEITTAKILNLESKLNKLKERLEGLEDNSKKLDTELKILEDNIKNSNTREDMFLNGVKSNNSSVDEKSLMIKEYEKLSYFKEKNIIPQENKLTAINILNIFSEEISPLFMALIVILLIGDVVSVEHSEGTLRCYLCQPINKRNLLISKYIATLISTFIIVLGFQLLLFILFGMINGWDGLKQPIEYGAKFMIKDGLNTYIEGSQSFIPAKEFIVRYFILQSLYIVTIVTIGMLSSVIFNSSTISLIVGSGVILFVYYGFVALSTSLKLQPLIFICYGDIWSILTGNLQQVNVRFTEINSILSFIITSLLCCITSFVIFIKKEVYS